MLFVQEIYYVTTGLYRQRKSLYLVLLMQEQNSRSASVIEALSKEHIEQFRSKRHTVELPSINVTPREFKHYEGAYGVNR